MTRREYKYILKGHEPVPCHDPYEWATWYENADAERQVADDEPRPGARVSTIFLGVDNAFGRYGPPLLFETMIFGGDHHGHQTRARTWDEALANHARAVALVLGATGTAEEMPRS